MPVYKRNNGVSWLIKFDLEGKTHYGSCRGSKRDALNKEAKLRAEVEANGQKLPKASTFAQFIETVYRPWAEANKRSYATADAVYLKPLLAAFGKYRLSQISPFLIEQYKRKRRDEPTHRGQQRSPASVNRELECLSKILTLAVHNDQLIKNPARAVKRLRPGTSRERVLSAEEQIQLESALLDSPDHLRFAVALAIETGLRRGELLHLAESEVNYAAGEIRLIQSKTGKPKRIPLSTLAKEALQQIKPVQGRFFSVKSFKTAWRSACQRAGIEGLRFNDLRHTAATRWRQAGADEFTVMRLLGHSQVNTSAIYANVEQWEARQIVENARIVAKSLQQEKRPRNSRP